MIDIANKSSKFKIMRQVTLKNFFTSQYTGIFSSNALYFRKSIAEEKSRTAVREDYLHLKSMFLTYTMHLKNTIVCMHKCFVKN